jgi:hypothetical protein
VTGADLLSRTVRDGDCLIWTGAVQTKGYGSVSIDGRSELAHRASYRLNVGPIPDGRQIDHVKTRGCRSRLCINPTHLEPVTNRENTNRTGHGSEERCKRGHLLSGSNLRVKSRGPGRTPVRNCWACTRSA